MSTMSNVDNSHPQTGLSGKCCEADDPRLKSERFRAIVRKCLEYIGEVPNHGSFRKWDKFIDWVALARSIDRPTRTALCYVVDRSDEVIEKEGTPVVVAVEIVACSECEAANILSKESKVFIEWWPRPCEPRDEKE